MSRTEGPPMPCVCLTPFMLRAGGVSQHAKRHPASLSVMRIRQSNAFMSVCKNVVGAPPAVPPAAAAAEPSTSPTSHVKAGQMVGTVTTESSRRQHSSTPALQHSAYAPL
ncbi:hypothetical protein E2C01_021825 [Portunus trituberculatus]|uniref:Uncharacterized protein n=1 Tax=Portunus trituberculatus TaxID=210409 RepID=A0A5B7E5L6_PORTR|nr:hypothetical protein [Portunus trituberculatus]